jgi:hypothetical protein
MSSKLWSSAVTKRNAPSAGARDSSRGFQYLQFRPKERRLFRLRRERAAVAAIRAAPAPVPCPMWTSDTGPGRAHVDCKDNLASASVHSKNKVTFEIKIG